MNPIIDFLKNGMLGEIKIGSTRQSVQKYLGEPEAISVIDDPYIILKYGCIQLTFYKEDNDDHKQYILRHINIEFYNDSNLCDVFNIEGWYPTSKTNYTEFVQIAKENNITLVKDKQHTFENDQFGLKTDNGVVIIFNDDNQNKEILCMGLYEDN